MRRNLTKTCLGVIFVAAGVIAEIAQGEAVQVPAVGRVTERAEIRVVRRDNKNPASRREQAVKFLHRPDYVRNVFDDMNGPDFSERIVPERKRNMIEIGNHIRARIRITVQADGAGVFVDAAADIENGLHLRAVLSSAWISNVSV